MRRETTHIKQIQTAIFGVPEYEVKQQSHYRPRICPEHLDRLWQLKQRSGKPITLLVSEALDCYFEKNGKEVR